MNVTDTHTKWIIYQRPTMESIFHFLTTLSFHSLTSNRYLLVKQQHRLPENRFIEPHEAIAQLRQANFRSPHTNMFSNFFFKSGRNGFQTRMSPKNILYSIESILKKSSKLELLTLSFFLTKKIWKSLTTILLIELCSKLENNFRKSKCKEFVLRVASCDSEIASHLSPKTKELRLCRCLVS